MPTPALPRSHAQRLGRRGGVALFSLIFAGATLLWTIQILRQVWPGSQAPSKLGCRGGTAQLEVALARARSAGAAAAENERVALSRYRSALEPEWAERRAIESACKKDSQGREQLRQVIALRYAEEHAVRYESLGLAPLRRLVHARTAPP